LTTADEAVLPLRPLPQNIRRSSPPRNFNDANMPTYPAHKPRNIARRFSSIANYVATASGRPGAFVASVLVVVIWAACGPIFQYSDTWQLVINTGTTIVTFLMVFLIQNSQNRDNAAIQVKLDELIRVTAAKNFFIGIEHLTEAEITRLREMCERRADPTLVVHKIDQKAKAAAEAVSG
jgi:low affinity Fe/Cu permease